MKIMSGNMNELTTDGSVVYRQKNGYSTIVNAFILYLNKAGFKYAPQYVESSETYDSFSFIEGETTSLNNILSYQEHVQYLYQLSQIINEFHALGALFNWSSKHFFLKYPGDLPIETICHNDIAPYNTIERNGQIMALIDYDTICPGPRIWDIVYASYRFIGLGSETLMYQRTYDSKRLQNERNKLVTMFCEFCHIDDTSNFYNILIQRLESLCTLFDQEIEKGNESFIKMKHEGHYDFYKVEIQYIKDMYYKIG